MSGTIIGVASGALALAVVGIWARRAMAVRIPDDKRGFVGAMAIAFALGACAFGLGVGTVGGIGARLGMIAGGLFLVLNAFARQGSIVIVSPSL